MKFKDYDGERLASYRQHAEKRGEYYNFKYLDEFETNFISWSFQQVVAYIEAQKLKERLATGQYIR